MPEVAIGWIAIVSGAAGLFLSHVGSLIPSRKDFVGQLALKRQTCVERLASKHYFLLQDFSRNEDFDNVARGDGVNERDLYGEYASEVMLRNEEGVRLADFRRWFSLFHWALLLSVVFLIVGGMLVGLGFWSEARLRPMMITLLLLEGASLVGLYALGTYLERIE